MTRRRLFDALDLAGLRACATRRDVVALVIIAIVCAAVPVLFTILGVSTED